MDCASWSPSAPSMPVPIGSIINAHRGVTYYNFSSDQFMGFHGIVIPGTLRDSMYILDGTGAPDAVATD